MIVLDMVMPKGINGRKTYEQIIKICPGQREGHALPEWTWPKRRIFEYMLKLIDGPLSLGIGGLRRIGKTTLLKQLVGELNANRSRLTTAYLDYLRWGGFPELKEIDDEESRRRYIKEVVVEKILRYDLPARFRGENPNCVCRPLCYEREEIPCPPAAGSVNG